ncbi:MAG: Beta-hexosaminidase A [candidate division WS2 bacterium]|nr:Beta-hexosaminidase A [Candidatus Lithacetigena glycinireducens]
MDLREIIGSLFFVGIEGTALTTQEIKFLTNECIGGVILFSRNLKEKNQVNDLINSIKSLATPQPLVAIDHEGGLIERWSQELTPFPGNMALGAVDDEKLAYQQGKAMGQELHFWQIDINFAPVLDVLTCHQNPVIGVRSFSDDPFKVAKLGTSLAKGLYEEGVLPVFKHFPGHGGTISDSHLELPIISKDLHHLYNIHLYPFKEAIKDHALAIMTSHVLYTSLDQKYPATLSKSILTNLLRKELGFRGLVFTDCLEMKALDSFGDFNWRSLKTLYSGADILLISHSQAKAKSSLEHLRKELKERLEFRSVIETSLRRLDEVKSVLNKNIERKIINSTKHKEIADTIRGNSLTLYYNDGIIPLRDAVPLIKIYEDITEKDLKHTLDVHKTVIIASCDAFKTECQIKIINQVKALDNRIIHLVAGNPVDLRLLPESKATILTYSKQEGSLSGAIDLIYGKRVSKGKIPLKII